nr:hypothetical protein [uncultured Lichenicoccus sp.]
MFDLLVAGLDVVGLIRHDQGAVRQSMQQALDRPAVSDMAFGKAEGDQAPETIGQDVDLGGAATAADADGLGLAPPFPPAAQRWALTWVLLGRSA